MTAILRSNDKHPKLNNLRDILSWMERNQCGVFIKMEDGEEKAFITPPKFGLYPEVYLALREHKPKLLRLAKNCCPYCEKPLSVHSQQIRWQDGTTSLCMVYQCLDLNNDTIEFFWELELDPESLQWVPITKRALDLKIA